MQVVDFIHQLLFENLELSVVAKLGVLLPVVELWQSLFQIGTRLFFGEILIHHVRHAGADQRVHIAVGIFSVRITPFAVILIQCFVFVPADDGILQRHSAALADELTGFSEQRVDGNVEKT